MLSRGNAFLRHQRQRSMRPDAMRYLRPDAARFLKPGSAKASVYPAWAQKWDGQPRLPDGSGRGQFTFGTMDDSATPDVTENVDTPRGRQIFVYGPWATFPEGNGEGEGQANGDDVPLLWLASDIGGPNEQPPELPDNKPNTSSQRNAYLRSIASFLGRYSGPIADAFIGLLNEIEWIERYQDLIEAARDPPKTLGELQSYVGKGRRGYDDHHIIEKAAAERWGMPRSEINDRSNIVSIPRLKHYQITGWFQTGHPSFGGLSPREYLSDKSLEERRRVGLEVLELFKVLKR